MTVEITVTLTLNADDEHVWKFVSSTKRSDEAEEQPLDAEFRVERKVLPTGSSTLAPGLFAPVAS